MRSTLFRLFFTSLGLCSAEDTDKAALPDVDLSWEEVYRVISGYFPLDGLPKSPELPEIQSLEGRRLYRDFYTWYQKQPSLYVSHANYKDPVAVLALQAFILYTSNDSERCIQLGVHGALADLIALPLATVVDSGWPIFGMLHEVSTQLRSTSGYPLYNYCDSLDDETSDAFHHQIGVMLEDKTPLYFAEEKHRNGVFTSRDVDSGHVADGAAESSSESDSHEQLAEIYAHSLKNKFRVSGLNILRYLTRNAEPKGDNWWHLGKCTFGKAAAAFAMALMSDDANEMEELVQEGQKFLMNYNHGNTIYDLISTRWPLWKLLDLVQKRLFTEKKIASLKDPAGTSKKNIEVHTPEGTKEVVDAKGLGPAQGKLVHTRRRPLTQTTYPESVFLRVPESEYFPYSSMEPSGLAKGQSLAEILVIFIRSEGEVSERGNRVLTMLQKYFGQTVVFDSIADFFSTGFEELAATQLEDWKVLLICDATLHALNSDFLRIGVATGLYEMSNSDDVNAVGFPIVSTTHEQFTASTGVSEEPVVDGELFYEWQPRRLRHLFDSIQFLRYPTGYSRTKGKHCYEADAGMSTTRLFKNLSILLPVLREARDIMQRVKAYETGAILLDRTVAKEYCCKAVEWANAVAAIDVAAKNTGLTQHLCFTKPLMEQNYLEIANIPVENGMQFSSANQMLSCSSASVDAAEMLIEKLFGTVHPLSDDEEAKFRGGEQVDKMSFWCFERIVGMLIVKLKEVARTENLVILQNDADLPRLTEIDLYEKKARLSFYIAEVSPRAGEAIFNLAKGHEIKVVKHQSSDLTRKAMVGRRISLFGEELILMGSEDSGTDTAAADHGEAEHEVPIRYIVCGRANDADIQERISALKNVQVWADAGTAEKCAKQIKDFDFDESAYYAMIMAPFLDENWDILSVERKIRKTLEPALAAKADAHFAAFFPIVTPDNIFRDTCRRLRVQYWKLQYYTPSNLAEAPCITGSAFRVLSGKIMTLMKANLFGKRERESFPGTKPQGPESFTLSALLVEMDLVLERALSDKDANVKSLYAKPENAVRENHFYLDSSAGFDLDVADAYQFEILNHEDYYYENCMLGLNWFQINARGVVGSYCFRSQLESHFRYFVDWWVGEKGGQAVPEEGTLLSIWRNGVDGGMPWDSDFDVKLYTETLRDKDDFHAELKQKFEAENRTTQAWNFHGCGADHYFLVRIPNITHHIGDVYYQNNITRTANPWKVKLVEGTNSMLSVSQGHMEHIYFDRYRAPVEKRFGDHGSNLVCWSDHSACLPNTNPCADGGGDCVGEFPDRFVHVSNWDIPEREKLFWAT